MGKVEAREFFRLHDRRVVHVEWEKFFAAGMCVCAREGHDKGKESVGHFPFLSLLLHRRNTTGGSIGGTRSCRVAAPRAPTDRVSLASETAVVPFQRFKKKRHTPEFPPKG